MAARFKEFISLICASSKEENPEFTVRIYARPVMHGAPTILQRIVTFDPVWKFDRPVNSHSENIDSGLLLYDAVLVG